MHNENDKLMLALSVRDLPRQVTCDQYLPVVVEAFFACWKYLLSRRFRQESSVSPKVARFSESDALRRTSGIKCARNIFYGWYSLANKARTAVLTKPVNYFQISQGLWAFLGSAIQSQKWGVRVFELIVHDIESCDLKDFWAFENLVGVDFAAQWGGFQDQHQYEAAVNLIISSLISQYVASVNNLALQLERCVQNVNTAVDTRLRENKFDGLSNRILEFNNCSHEI